MMEFAGMLRPDVAADLLKTLDMLAVALADHGHEWTNDQRKAYERAVAILRTKV